VRQLTVATLASALLDPILRDNPMGPRITYYDDGTGERIEVSAVTLANWAAKTANLLRDELGAGPGSRVAVLLPAHWQTAAVLFGIWYIGAEVVLAGPADIALCTEGRVDEADAALEGGLGELVVLSLDPFGTPVADLPIGVTDYATSVRAHGDQIVPASNPGPALTGQSVEEVLSQAEIAAAAQGLTKDDRVLTSLPWSTSAELVANLVAVFAAGASLVQVTDPESAAQERRRTTEKVTRELA
jgi:uncharacterized protein (TIGR03089 family)